ncbi:MAG TPA: LuxR C-terminal-related transcriptional regulator, partial [Solirubrobacteraceae bacterium]|nr:LuxR C-terminal-related transcriptional regulator [Solirubrobacteraceae bacterium]
MPNRCAPERIWLIAEEPRDEAAGVLRSGGAEVTEVHADVHERMHAARDRAKAHELGPPPVVVVTSSKTGRALVKTVARLSEQALEGMAILVCDHAGPLDVRLLLEAGVRGIVLREQMAETLLPAVAAVASGQVCVPTRDVIGAERPVLSIREKQVMGLVAMGLMNIEIAERLFLA